MEGRTDIIGRRTETKRRTAIGWSGQVTILQILWDNKENRRQREVLGQERDNGEMKEKRARLRCGNIGKVGEKGYED